jgi:predicted nucleotide-binding protein
MELSAVERDITNTVVKRFLRDSKPSPRNTLAREYRFSQFHRLTGWNILTNTVLGAATVDEVYLPRAAAFHYCGDPEALQLARESVALVVHALQNLYDSQPDKKEFTFEDLTAEAGKIDAPRPEPETVKLGLYLVRELGLLSSCPGDPTQLGPFQIAERIVEISDFAKVWDDFVKGLTVTYEEAPQDPAAEIDLGDGDILSHLGGLYPMARPPRVSVPEPHRPTISPELALKKLEKLLEQIPEVRAGGHDSHVLSTWEGNAKIVLGEFYGESSLPFREFRRIAFGPSVFYDGQPQSDFVKYFNQGLDEAKGFLESRINDLRDRMDLEKPTHRASLSSDVHLDSRRIFVVHGHDHGRKETVARFLTTLSLKPVILHEQADCGKTVIEKFEDHAADVRCAVVILTADDVAYAKTDPDKKELRARQNVILELGYFVGKLGRARTFALVENGVELPSDIHGVVYIQLDEGHWRLRLVKELKAAGLDVDANLAV